MPASPAPPTVDTRTYRTELEQPSACGGRWGLYVDGRLIARSDGPLDHVAAQEWACAQLGCAPDFGGWTAVRSDS
ncbi:MAG: hypothetical protein M3313_09435 [Actinomycetota bacterium]|nr:hypothetical protein [Actinomycetota bacterium]